MITYQELLKKREELDDTDYEVTCDCCGELYQNPLETQEFLHISFVGGYSSVFGDGNLVECNLCQQCLFKILAPYVTINGNKLRPVTQEDVELAEKEAEMLGELFL